MRTRQHLALSLLVGLLLVPIAAIADSHEQPMPLTWLNFVKAQTGQGGALGQHIAEGGAKIYNPLMAGGQILTWGVAQPINHFPGDEWTHLEWVTFSGWAAVDSFMQAFMAGQMAKSPEEMMAEQEEYQSLVEPGSHRDEIFRHMVVVRGEGMPPAYFNLSYFPGKPGRVMLCRGSGRRTCSR